MMQSKKRWVVVGMLLAALVGVGALSFWLPSAHADFVRTEGALSAQIGALGTPSPVPSDAQWNVQRMEFASHYPDGFSFTLQATSSGGPIVRATVEWQHREHNRPNQPITVRRAEGEIDPQTGLITARWQPSGATAVPPWVGVYYVWKLRDEAGNEYVTERAFAEYSDDSHVWKRTEDDKVIVFATGLPDDIGDLVVQAVDAQYPKYVEGWGASLPYRPRVILFGDFDSWLEWQVGHQDTSGLGVITVGMTSDTWGGTVQVVTGSARELAYGTVVHEIEHLHQYEFLAGRVSFTPGWFIEGDATFYQMDRETLDYADWYVQNLINNNDLPLLLHGPGPTTGGEDALHGYYMGYKFFQWLTEKWGMQAHRDLMGLLAEDMNFYEAIEAVTGMDLDTAERTWRAWLGADPNFPTLIPTPTPLPFLPTPTMMTFGN